MITLQDSDISDLLVFRNKILFVVMASYLATVTESELDKHNIC